MALISTLARAGLKRGKATFAGLFFLMALTSTTLCFTIGLYTDLNARQAEALAQAGAGDIFAYDVPQNLTDEVVEELRSLDEVGEVRAYSGLSIPARFSHAGEESDKTPTLSNMFEAWGEGLRYQVLTQDGTAFVEDAQAPRAGELYVPASWSLSPGVEVGDTVELLVGDEVHPFTIAAFFEDPQVGTMFMEVKRCLLAPDDFEKVGAAVDEALAESGAQFDIFTATQQAFRVVQMNADLSAEAQAAGLTSNDLTRIIAEETLWGKTTSGLFSAATLTGYAMMVVIVGTAVCAVFALLLFIIALVICTHAVSTSIEQDYADFGTLKALGVSCGTLSRVLVLEYGGASLLGLLVGLVLSLGLVPAVLPLFTPITGVLASSHGMALLSVACVVLLTALVVGVVALKARKLSRISPLVAFRGGARDVRFASRLARPVTGRLLNAQLAMRAVVSAKRRYIGLLTCSFLLSAFIVLVFGIGGTLGAPGAAYAAFGMWTSDVSVRVPSDDVPFAEVEQAIEEVSPIENSWKERFAMVNLGGESRAFVGLTDLTLVSEVAEGREPRYDNEVIIGPNLARTLGLAVGDELELEVAGEPRTLMVSGLLSGMLNAGYGCVLTYDAFCSVFGTDVDDASVARQYTLAYPEAADEVRHALEERFGDAVDVRPTGLFADTSDLISLIQTLFMTMAYLMAAVAAALAFLAVGLITSRMFTAERQDLGVYRALGFTASRLRRQFALRFFLVALVGCVLGAITATLGGGNLMGQLFGLFGVTKFNLASDPLVVSALTLGFALVFFVAAYAGARKIKHVDVRELVAD
ncbi:MULTISPECIES: ABC transporter permease [Gordonibacter]|uniref:ABC transporter permease n=1 Tax=Gordonibacter faecis TaxID=3047475 RepID=A0ABT7DPY3_9ACTN|nr:MULTISPECIES: ABC transporter permease [unclassified Gordonibacter]MDJ1651612.1 ABC transporter permease [Gordonibacter sp. KGMB12511]HIW77034.1 ABC transporter permease [Candidatus Gordonibacter avicola]